MTNPEQRTHEQDDEYLAVRLADCNMKQALENAHKYVEQMVTPSQSVRGLLLDAIDFHFKDATRSEEVLPKRLSLFVAWLQYETGISARAAGDFVDRLKDVREAVIDARQATGEFLGRDLG